MSGEFEPPIPVPVSSVLANAVRREWLESQVEDVLDAGSGGRIVLVVGQPGCGKTTFAAQLARRWNCVCLILRGGHVDSGVTADPKNALIELGLQLRDRYGAEIFGTPRLEARGTAQVTGVADGGELLGVSVGKVRLSPFRRVLLEGDLEVTSLAGRATSVWIGELTDAVAELTVAQVAQEAIVDPLRRLAELRPGERVRIVVDALDESPGLARVLPIESELPANSSWLVTSRLGTHIDRFEAQREDHVTRISLGDPALRRRQVADAEAYLRRRLAEPGAVERTDEAVREIAEASNGNFLYVRHFPLDATDLAPGSLPQNLDAIYRYLVTNRLRAAVPDDRRQDFDRVLGVLAVAFAPLTSRQIARYAAVEPDFADRTILHIGQFVDRLPTGDDLGFSVYHRSFAEFLLTQDRSRNPVPLEPEAEQHRRIARTYADWTDDAWLGSGDMYALTHLVDHLAAADAPVETSTLVAGDFLRRQWEILGPIAARASVMTAARLDAVHGRDVALLDMLARARELAADMALEWESGRFTLAVLAATPETRDRLKTGGPVLPWSAFLCAERLLDLGDDDGALALLDALTIRPWHGYGPDRSSSAHGFAQEGLLWDVPEQEAADFIGRVATLDPSLALMLNRRLYGALPWSQYPNAQSRWRDALKAFLARDPDQDMCRKAVDVTASWMCGRGYSLGRAGIADALYALLARLAPAPDVDELWFANHVLLAAWMRTHSPSSLRADQWLDCTVANLTGLVSLAESAPAGSQLRVLLAGACEEIVGPLPPLQVPSTHSYDHRAGLLGRFAELLERAHLPQVSIAAEAALRACELDGACDDPPINAVAEGLRSLRRMTEPGVSARAEAIAARLGLTDQVVASGSAALAEETSLEVIGRRYDQFEKGALALRLQRDGGATLADLAKVLVAPPRKRRRTDKPRVLSDVAAEALVAELVPWPASWALNAAERLAGHRTDQAKQDAVFVEGDALRARWNALADQGAHDLLRTELESVWSSTDDVSLLAGCCVHAAEVDPALAMSWWQQIGPLLPADEADPAMAMMVAAVARRHPDQLDDSMIGEVTPANLADVCRLWLLFGVLRDATVPLLRDLTARLDPAADAATLARHLEIAALAPHDTALAGKIAAACDGRGTEVLKELDPTVSAVAGPGADLAAALLASALDDGGDDATGIGFATALAVATWLKQAAPAVSERGRAEALRWWTRALDAEYAPREVDMMARMADLFAAVFEREFRSPHERKMFETTVGLTRWAAAPPAQPRQLTQLRSEIGKVVDLELRALLMAPLAEAWLRLGNHDEAGAAADQASLTGLAKVGYLALLPTAPVQGDHVVALLTREQPEADLDLAIGDLLRAWFAFRLANGDPERLVQRMELWLSGRSRRGDMEPITLAVVSAVAVTEGIKFLYGQAGELLKRRRERKAQKAEQDAAPVTLPPPPAEVFEGTVQQTPADFEVVEKFHEDLAALWQALAPYAQEIEDVDVGNTALLETTDAMRKLIEIAYGQRLTFKGEARSASGPMVVGKVQIDDIAGEVAAVRARNIRSGQVHGTVTGKDLRAGAKAVGVEVDGEIG